MKSVNLPRIGGRVWKTGIAVALSLAVCRAFNIPEPVFAGVAAVICIQPTVLQSFKKGLQRLQATVIGALVGLAAIALISHWPMPYAASLVGGAAVIIVLWFCLAFRWPDALVLAAATVVVIISHIGQEDNLLVYAAERTLVTAIGVVVASLVNGFVVWPNVEDRFPKRLPEVAEQAFNEFEDAVSIFCRRDLEAARAALEQWKEQSSLFTTASTELSWFQETNTVKQMLPMHRKGIAPLFAEIFFTIDTIHHSSHSLLEETVSILEDNPKYILQDAQVYQIIGKALYTASNLRQAITRALTTMRSGVLEDSEIDWTAELHKQFISAIRSAHRSPRDIFPLFEVAKVGIELRNYTRMLARIRLLLLENEEILSTLHKYR